MKAQDAYNEISTKLAKCNLEKLECKTQPVTVNPPVVVKPKPNSGTVGPYNGYKMTQGKCRRSDKYSYSRNHVYNLKTTRYKVNTEQGCSDRCNADNECKGFQYYQNDPGAYDNCNIWTSTGYLGNGSKTSKCYMKLANQATTTHTNRCSTIDPDCVQCMSGVTVGGCLKCSAGHYLLAGTCYKTNGIWGSNDKLNLHDDF